MTHHSETSASAIDPVCGRRVDPRQTRFIISSGNEMKYFCSEKCQRGFTASGWQAAATSRKKKGFWARYLARLNKATGGKTPPCCG